MLDLLIGFAIIALGIYILKSMEPIYRYIKNRLAVRGERKKIQAQQEVYDNRVIYIKSKGWTKATGFFYKLGMGRILDSELRGWSDQKFMESLKEQE